MFRFYSLILSLLLSTQLLFSGENYGLIYNTGDDAPVGKTSFDATRGGRMMIQDTLKVDFKYSLVSHRKRFGYIARLIFNDKTTLNFILNSTSPTLQKLSVVCDGVQICDEKIKNSRDLAYDWNEISLKVVPSDDIVLITINGSEVSHKLSLPDNSNVRILFAANDVENFMVKDVPTVIVRDLAIESGQERYLWRFKEHDGDSTFDEINGVQLDVNNPTWEVDLHSSWCLEREYVRSERLFPLFDGKNMIHIIGQNDMINYNLETGRSNATKFVAPIERNNINNQFVYDPKARKIRYFDATHNCNYHSTYYPAAREWRPKISAKNEANYHQNNLFVSPVDSTIVQLFGYGFFRYNSSLLRVDGDEVEMHSLEDYISPRYLASVGIDGQWCYVYGGVGNDSGRQELGSNIFCDLYRVDLKTNRVDSLWSMKDRAISQVACRDMVIMPENTDKGISLFYNPFHKSTELNLMSINFKDAEIVPMLHDPIPYNFEDVESQAQLIYVDRLSKLFAITVDRGSNGEYRVRIYSIAYPVFDVVKQQESNLLWTIVWILTLIVILTLIAVYFVVRKRISRATSDESIMGDTASISKVNVIAPIITESRDITIVHRVKRPGIYLLDGFTIIDRDENDITNEFAPLMKQLLSLIILYTRKNGKGVSNTILKDVLWFDKSDSSARNNRSVTISKIRQSLQKVGGYQILFNNSYWRIEYSEGDFCDYAYACQTIDSIESADEHNRVAILSEVAQLGDLLPNQMFDFFDGFKAEYVSMVIDTMNNLLHRCSDHNDKVTLANLILRFDKVDESATREKCLALIELGKNGVAKITFDNFTREYATLFGEGYEASFDEFIKEK